MTDVILDRRIRLIGAKVLMAIKLPQSLEPVARHMASVARLAPGMTAADAPALGPGNRRVDALIEARDGLDRIIEAMQAGEEFE